MYAKQSLKGHFFIAPGFYILRIPVKVPYKRIYSLADSAGLKQKAHQGPILESGKMLGFGWIGVEVEIPSTLRCSAVYFNRSAGDCTASKPAPRPQPSRTP